MAATLAACGVVDEDGAWLSERTARETQAAARELARRGEHLRAAEAYEGLALGFPDQHWADDALAGAAASREALSRRAEGALAAVTAREAAALWERLLDRYPDSPHAARARRSAGLLWVRAGDCRRALPHLRELDAGGREDPEVAAARAQCADGSR